MLKYAFNFKYAFIFYKYRVSKKNANQFMEKATIQKTENNMKSK